MKYLSVKKIIYFEILNLKKKENFNILLHKKINKKYNSKIQKFWK